MKLNPIASAAAAQVISMELTGAEREVALKLPMKQAMRDHVAYLAERLNRHLHAAIAYYLGRDDFSEKHVRRTLVVQADPPHTPPEQRGDTYFMLGTPILHVGPVRLQRQGDESIASQLLTHLQPGMVPPEDVGAS